jgi:putative tricarboxylic transport membrane protein
VLEGLADAVLTVLSWPNLLFVVGGVLAGVLIGILPGLGGAVVLALLIPLTFGLEEESAVILLIAANGVITYGGMITSVLLNTPGTPENAATTQDGYPMARQGRAAEAIGAGATSATLGGILGLLVLVLLVPVAREFILVFSYPEFFMMAVFALTVIAVVTQGQVYKGLIAAGVGFMLAFIGLDPVAGNPRFTFGQLYLWDGLNIVPVLIGLFAGAEMLSLYGQGTPVLERSGRAAAAVSTFAHGVRQALRHWTLVGRGGLIGVLIGIVPGVGGVVASFLAYGQAVQTSRTPERFGKGAVEGVIAAEAANDAKDGGSLLPTVAFGIPGSVAMAMLLGALILHGVPAGPTLMLEEADLVYVMIVTLLGAKLLALLLVRVVGTRATVITRVRPTLLTPVIVVTALTGAYALNRELLDVAVVLVASAVGFAMRRYGFSRIALVIALILGGLVEGSYHQTLAAFGGVSGFATRPISATLAVLSVAVLVVPPVLQRRRRHREQTADRPAAVAATGTSGPATGAAAETAAPQGGASRPGPRPGAVVLDLVLAGFTGALVWDAATDLGGDAGLVPLIVGVPTLAGLVVLLVRDLAGRSPAGDGSVAAARDVQRREWTFALWAVGLVALAALTSFLVAIPVGVLVFMKVVNRESWLLSLALAAGTWGFVYALFDLVLGVRF